MTTHTDRRYYKVLLDGRSCNGGDMPYSLPTRNGDGWEPGEWHDVDGRLDMCRRGLHLTCEPARWWNDGTEIYEAEHDGEVLRDGSDKICCQRVRLVRKVEDLSEVAIYGPGQKHEHRSGRAIALPGASVVARGNAYVEARGNAYVVARGNAYVEARGNAYVVARDNAYVVARDNAYVEAWDNASVVARGNASVVAWENASVVARENASVEARDNATVNTPLASWHHPTVKVVGHAVWIDRRSGEPVIHAVTAPEIVTHAEGES